MFKKLIQQIQDQFVKTATGQLFVTNVNPDLLWETYLKSFENSSIWRVNDENDCNADKHFVRRYGNIVAIVNGKLVTLWDILPSSEYINPMQAMSELVKNSAIESPFIIDFDFLHKSNYQRTTQNQASFQLGHAKSLVQYTAETAMGKEVGKVYEFNFFHIFLPKKFVDFSGKSPESIIGELKTTRQLFEKGLNIPLETLELVRDLIQQGSLLRGDMYLPKVIEFIKLKKEFNSIPTEQRTNWLWLKFQSIPYARFANELIGTTCIELAEGADINKVCKDFNYRIDPVNYNKSKSPVTPQMIQLAEKTITELGYDRSFERRFAKLEDIDVSEIKHTNTDNNVEKPVGLFGKAGVTTNGFSRHKRAEFEKVETVSIDKFMQEILPNTTSIEVFMENRMESHLVSLFTSQEDTKNLFKWNNPFSWTYKGNLSGKSQLTQMVESKGGRVDGVFRFTHSWNELEPNQSLMDLHVFFPSNHHTSGSHDTYGNGERVGWNNRNHSRTKGKQDVDYTQAAPVGYIPVENITFPELNLLPEGDYKCKIHNWNFRGTGGKGKAEVAINGEVYQYVYPATKHKEWIDVATVTLKNGKFTIIHHLPETSSSRNIWNLETNQFHKVNLVCTSPNHWGDNNIGTKEYFFMLQDCKTDQPMRAFHIDQLNSELMANRKAIDLLGNYKMVEPSDKQLSGVGFNSTVRDELIVKVKGSHQRIIRLLF